ncbi:MAG: hypothetical protein AAGF11_29340 [Myxococcota bacterium]
MTIQILPITQFPELSDIVTAHLLLRTSSGTVASSSLGINISSSSRTHIIPYYITTKRVFIAYCIHASRILTTRPDMRRTAISGKISTSRLVKTRTIIQTTKQTSVKLGRISTTLTLQVIAITSLGNTRKSIAANRDRTSPTHILASGQIQCSAGADTAPTIITARRAQVTDRGRACGVFAARRLIRFTTITEFGTAPPYTLAGDFGIRELYTKSIPGFVATEWIDGANS